MQPFAPRQSALPLFCFFFLIFVLIWFCFCVLFWNCFDLVVPALNCFDFRCVPGIPCCVVYFRFAFFFVCEKFRYGAKSKTTYAAWVCTLFFFFWGREFLNVFFLRRPRLFLCVFKQAPGAIYVCLLYTSPSPRD